MSRDRQNGQSAKLSDFRPDQKNANKGTQRGLKALDNSLRTLGAGRSILVDKHGNIIAGNKTVERAADIGLDDVIVVKTDGTKIVAVMRTDLDLYDGDTARKLAYADNWVGQIDFELDTGILATDLLSGLDLSSIFDEKALADLGIDFAEKPEDPGAQIDRAAELNEKWKVKTGDIFQIGRHKLICGDCTDRAVVERLMGGERAALCVTDPPYNVNYDPQWRVGVGGGGKQDFANGGVITNDDNTSWIKCFDSLPADVLYCWTAGVTLNWLQGELEQRGFVIAYLIIWNKDLAVFGRGDYHHKHEPCLYMVRAGCNHNWHGDRKQDTVWDIPTIHSFANGHNADEWGLVGHGNQKPIECMERPIRNNSADGEIIIDPFAGSGTTLVAAERLGRVCRAVEISPNYCAVILERMTGLGLTPERVG